MRYLRGQLVLIRLLRRYSMRERGCIEYSTSSTIAPSICLFDSNATDFSLPRMRIFGKGELSPEVLFVNCLLEPVRFIEKRNLPAFVETFKEYEHNFIATANSLPNMGKFVYGNAISVLKNTMALMRINEVERLPFSVEFVELLENISVEMITRPQIEPKQLSQFIKCLRKLDLSFQNEDWVDEILKSLKFVILGLEKVEHLVPVCLETLLYQQHFWLSYVDRCQNSSKFIESKSDALFDEQNSETDFDKFEQLAAVSVNMQKLTISKLYEAHLDDSSMSQKYFNDEFWAKFFWSFKGLMMTPFSLRVMTGFPEKHMQFIRDMSKAMLNRERCSGQAINMIFIGLKYGPFPQLCESSWLTSMWKQMNSNLPTMQIKEICGIVQSLARMKLMPPVSMSPMLYKGMDDAFTDLKDTSSHVVSVVKDITVLQWHVSPSAWNKLVKYIVHTRNSLPRCDAGRLFYTLSSINTTLFIIMAHEICQGRKVPDYVLVQFLNVCCDLFNIDERSIKQNPLWLGKIGRLQSRLTYLLRQINFDPNDERLSQKSHSFLEDLPEFPRRNENIEEFQRCISVPRRSYLMTTYWFKRRMKLLNLVHHKLRSKSNYNSEDYDWNPQILTFDPYFDCSMFAKISSISKKKPIAVMVMGQTNYDSNCDGSYYGPSLQSQLNSVLLKYVGYNVLQVDIHQFLQDEFAFQNDTLPVTLDLFSQNLANNTHHIE